MGHSLLGTVVYYVDDNVMQMLGDLNKTETRRIDNETVEDVVYTFNLELGEYVEKSYMVRAEPMLPTSETELERRISATEQAIIALMDLGML